MPKEKFVFAKRDEKIHDKELETKPLSYFADAMIRFRRNKGSIVAFFIISFLLLFSIVAPMLTPYKVVDRDAYFSFSLPKSRIATALGLNFWDGCQVKETNEETFLRYYAMGVETDHWAVKNQKFTLIEGEDDSGKITTLFKFRLDTYQDNSMVYMDLKQEDYDAIQKYQDETGILIIYPITDPELRPEAQQDKADANFWYTTKKKNGKTVSLATRVTKTDEKGKTYYDYEYENIYIAYTGLDENGAPKDGYTSKVTLESVQGLDTNGQARLYNYSTHNQTGYNVRVNYYEYYIYYHTQVLKDKISEPLFFFGSNELGKDIFTCLGSGARLSFFLAIAVSVVNLFVGAIYGSIEGYYGGRIDLAMERFVEILSAVPFMIVITLLKYHMEGSNTLLILFISFFLTGWIGMAGRTRMQFYRFKNSEYVLASRTLGAKDPRVMFKHIFPNSLGTIITGSVLAIPSVIFSETSLSYLGIINLETGKYTSVGTLLANGQTCLQQFPHVILWPSLFICLLMLSFNLFGNGLRDAFNPSLRGVED